MQNEAAGSEAADADGIFGSARLPGPAEMRTAKAAVLVSAAIFLAAVPFAKMPLAHMPAFIASYESMLVICDLITAVLLFSQFNVTRSLGLLVLAGGYLFSAFMAVPHALSYPDLFAPTGLLGGNAQSTAWLYFFWHGGFPLCIAAYALLGDGHPGRAVAAAVGTGVVPSSESVRTHVAVAATVAAPLAVVCWLTLLATTYHGALPALMNGIRFSSSVFGVVQAFWSLSLVALLLLWRRRPRTVLDLWLMVVMCGWIFDMALGAVFNTGRYDLGFYVGRLYGLMAAAFLLVLFLIENNVHYARLKQLSVDLRHANRSLERLSLHDGLTGLANRRYFDTNLADQIAVARRYKRPLALVLCDVDAFKAFNDHYGHVAGDACLQRVAEALASCCKRPADMAARYGGEEFVLVLPDTDLDGAVRIAETARDAVRLLGIPHGQLPGMPHVSISGGVAVLPWNEGLTALRLVEAADIALYQAKQRGRNRMVSWSPASVAA